MTERLFPKRARLNVAADFKRVFAEPSLKSGSKAVTILATYNDTGLARLGIVVSKRKARLAVDRNRIKRQIREAFRHKLWELAALDLVVLPKPGCDRMEQQIFREGVDRALNRLLAATKQMISETHGPEAPAQPAAHSDASALEASPS